MRNTKAAIAKWYSSPHLDVTDTSVNLDNHNKLQKLHNTYWRNCHGFLFNYIHNKHATCMFMGYAQILPLVSFWQHSIHKNSTNHIRAGGPGDNGIPPVMVISQKCAIWISPKWNPTAITAAEFWHHSQNTYKLHIIHKTNMHIHHVHKATTVPIQ